MTVPLVTGPLVSCTASRQPRLRDRWSRIATRNNAKNANRPVSSYLADTQLLRVTSYPLPNGGAVVNDLATALAADGPITVDCYEVLAQAATRAVAAARTPLLLNLGGDPVDEGVAAAVADQQVAAVQTSLDEADAADAEALSTDLLARLRPAAAVVTLGRLGALARTASGIHRAAAPPVAVAHTHGAGAAFSAGYAHAWLNGGRVEAALNAGCRAGATHCAIPATVPPGRTTTALAAS